MLNRITIFISLLVFSIFSYSQAINEPANWPNPDWELMVYEGDPDTQDIEADPTIEENFAYDDDDTPGGNHDVLAVISPIINLTPAFDANEMLISVSLDYVFRNYSDNEYLALEYWDEDILSWVSFHVFPNESTPGAGTDLYCEFETVSHLNYINISDFSATQLANFRYRIFYNDNIGTEAGAWNYGFCFSSPLLFSIEEFYIPTCVTNPIPNDGNLEVVFGSGYIDVSWDPIEDIDDTLRYSVYGGTNSESLFLKVEDLAEPNAVIYFEPGDHPPFYYWKVVPENSIGIAEDCPVWYFEFAIPPPAPDNNACENTIALIPGISFEDNFIQGNTVSSTASNEEPIPSCSSFGSGEDIWFSVTIPVTGSVFIETQNDGGITDTAFSVYSGTCGDLTEITCDDDSGIDYFTLISITDRTPGEELLIRVFDYQNNDFGTFSISAYEPSLGITTGKIEGVTIYPNPTNNILTVHSKSQIESIHIYDRLGKEMTKISVIDFELLIDVTNYQNGVYFIRIVTKDKTGIHTFIKE